MCGVVEDGIIPGLFGYEAGQSAVGDIFAWFTQHAVPPEVHAQAARDGSTVHDVLERDAGRLRPGESGLLVLDWWNGNRSILVDGDLSGLLIGATLATRPADIYRALLEATIFGTRAILESLDAASISVERVVACGGLPERNELLMQLSADITGRPFEVAASSQAPALGAAMHGAVAAGPSAGGFESIEAAVAAMVRPSVRVYVPDESATGTYDALYADYMALHDLFGRGGNDVMRRLRAAKSAAATRRAAAAEPVKT
jgi:L-ribulokinase